MNADTPEMNEHDSVNDATSQDTSSSANIGTSWRGDAQYFQTGKKAGSLKPRARNAGKKVDDFGGLDIESLNATSSDAPESDPIQSPDKKAIKAERKLVEAKIAAKFVMRILDTLTGWISKGSYGQDFSDAQRKERGKYRAELEEDWQNYLITLDIPMHPALVAIFGSVLYVAPAFETPAGQERSQSFKEKIISKIAVGIFSRKNA